MFEPYKNKYKEMIRLFHEYLKIIRKDHHKNRDGDIHVGYYHYGWEFDENEGEWRVIHNGYVNNFCICDKDLDQALNKAIAELKRLINEENEPCEF